MITGHESTFLSEDNGATLFCDTCGGQCRENEAHRCFQTLEEKNRAGQVQDAAPELLAALQDAENTILELVEDVCSGEDRGADICLVIIRAAIAKAEGE